ncbi:MAG: helicase associated domain-containing protein [Deltaproteobacteria bacterium]|nr:helicase associated domain-containing protein [Deltaproteobacteria bacterium]MBW2070066.1 helicase associated domain-containing protein [Deltaproteobacteria bacterium]
MKSCRTYALAAFFLAMTLIFSGQSLAGDMEVKLPDKDDTSSFQVKDSEDTVLMKVQSGGNVGIGTDTPTVRLTIKAQGLVGDPARRMIKLIPGGAQGRVYILSPVEYLDFLQTDSNDNLLGHLNISAKNGEFQGWVTIKADAYIDGDVGIGTTNPSSKLEVSGGDIRVTGGSFIDDGTTLNVPDYVFEEGYRLISLDELREYIKREKHLPDVPSTSQIKEQGLNIGQFQMRLLRKIEELTLHIIAQQEQIKSLEAELARINQQLGNWH